MVPIYKSTLQLKQITLKMQKTKDKEKIQEEIKGRKCVTYEEAKIGRLSHGWMPREARVISLLDKLGGIKVLVECRV